MDHPNEFRIEGKTVVIVLGNLELGGAERQALHLGRFLKSKGAMVQMWGFLGPGVVATRCEEYGIAWRVIPFVWPPSWVLKLGNVLRFGLSLYRSHSDVVISYTNWPNVVCGLVWRWSGAKVFLCESLT